MGRSRIYYEGQVNGIFQLQGEQVPRQCTLLEEELLDPPPCYELLASAVREPQMETILSSLCSNSPADVSPRTHYCVSWYRSTLQNEAVVNHSLLKAAHILCSDFQSSPCIESAQDPSSAHGCAGSVEDFLKRPPPHILWRVHTAPK